ncbi:MAG: hypothetical protein ACOX1L_05285 [Erysipelotrichaceae bacterium]|jgi:cell division protein FtsZ
MSKIKIVGVGGAGSNIVGYMFLKGIEEVQFIVMNTDEASLKANVCPDKVLLETDKPLKDPLSGRESVIYSQQKVIEVLQGGKVLILVAGLGGNTATSALAPIVEIAKDLGMYVVCMVTTPFEIEGKERLLHAHRTVIDLKVIADNVVVFHNEMFKKMLSDEATFKDVFEALNCRFLDGNRYIVSLFDFNSDYNDVTDIRQLAEDIKNHDFY